MKVLTIHNAYRHRGGEERAVESTVRLLQARGVEVVRLTRDSADLAGLSGKLRALTSGIWSRSARRETEDIIRRERPDVAHVHNLYPLLSPSVLVACAEMRVPVVMTCHSHRLICPIGVMFSHGAPCERCPQGGARWCLLRNCTGGLPQSAAYALRHAVADKFGWFRKHVTEFITPSRSVKRILTGHGWPEDRFHVVPHCVPLPPDDTEDAAGAPFAGYAGRLSPEKGVDVLLEAAALQPDIPIRIAGAGDMPLDDAPPNVTFLGRLAAGDMGAFYRSARFTLAPAACTETFGLAPAESMAHGTPVIASNRGAFPELVEDGVTGLLFEPGNARDLAEKMAQLWSSPEDCRTMGKAGRAKVASLCSEESHFEGLLRVYCLAIDRMKGGPI